jgi:outer membrane immunogenic protein
MFKSAMLGAAAALLAGQAIAADLVVKAPIRKAPPPIVDPWSGGYIGVNVGYSWGDWDTNSNQRVFNFESVTHSPKVDGVVGGAQAGYNWRAPGSQFVWGFEADIQITGEKDNHNWTHPGEDAGSTQDFVPRCCGPAALHHEWEFPWFATFRLRAGVLATETWLLYVTGGLAVGESKYSFNFSQPGAVFLGAPTTYALSSSKTKVGWTGGAGTELKLDPNWSLKLEYLFVDLGTQAINTLDIDGFPFHVDHEVRDHIVRLGLNWRWGGPIVAKY